MAEFAFEFWKRVDSLRGDMALTDLADDIGMRYQTMRNQRSQNQYPKRDDVKKIADVLHTSVNFLMSGENTTDISYCDEAVFIQQHPEARALIRAIMEDPSLLYPLSALVTRRSTVEGQEKQA